MELKDDICLRIKFHTFLGYNDLFIYGNKKLTLKCVSSLMSLLTLLSFNHLEKLSHNNNYGKD